MHLRFFTKSGWIGALVLALVLWPGLVAAQGTAAQGLPPEKDLTQFVYDEWTTQDGLPYGTITDILQTQDGYLWIGAEGGLARFDGVEFTVFNKSNTPAFARNHVMDLEEAPDGTLWIATFGGGLLRYRDGTFTRFSTEDGLSKNLVTGVEVAPDGTVWVTTAGGWVNRFDGERFITLDEDDGIPHLTTWTALAGSSGGVWIGSNAGLTRLSPSVDTTYGQPYGAIRVLEPASGKGIWAGGNTGVFRATPTGGIERFRPDAIPGGVRALYEDARGTLWIGTYGHGLARVTQGGDVDTFSTAEGLAGKVVMALYEDREGSLWIGTNRGLARLRDGAFTTYGKAQGLSVNAASAVRGFSDGRRVVASGGRLYEFSEEKNRFAPLALPPAARRKLKEVPVSAVTQTPDGAIWAGGKCGPLARIEDGRVRLYGNDDGLESGCINVIIPRADGGVWVGTDGGGLYYFDDGQFTDPGLAALPGLIFTLLEAKDGTLWVGTWGGLGRLEDGRLRMYHVEDGLAGSGVTALHEDASGTIWAGTAGGGLTRIRGDSLTSFSARDGLFSDVIHGIVQDRAGALWMISSRGIFRVTKSAIEAFAEGRAEQIAVTAFPTGRHGLRDGTGVIWWNHPPAWRMPGGRLWFATPGGAAVIDPAELQPNEIPPPVHIERFVAGGEVVAQDGEIELPPDTEDFAFHYAGLSYVAPEQVRFKYRLEGRSDDWTDAGSRRAAFYTNLEPGRYTFHVKAANSDGVWSAEGASLSFVLRPHFYETWWFYLLCALGLLAVGYGGYRWRVRRLKQRERALEDEVTERTEALRTEKEKTEQLYAQLEEDNARKTQELEEARRIQLSMLPEDPPAMRDLDVAVHMSTATEVGGDYYDFRTGGDGALLAAIGDATDHGMKAGLVVATAKSRFQALHADGDLPGAVRRLSQGLKDLDLRRMFMSFALIKCEGRAVRLVGAGMPPALWYRAGEEAVEEVPLKGAPLGSFPDFPYREHRLSLEAGDALLFMSDGLMELRGEGRALLGQAPIEAAFREAAPRGAEAVIRQLETLARRHAGAGRPPDDDITLIVMQARPSAP